MDANTSKGSVVRRKNESDSVNPGKKKSKKKDRKKSYSSGNDNSDTEKELKKSKSKHKKKCKKRHKHGREKTKSKEKSSLPKPPIEEENSMIGPEVPSEILQKAQSMAPLGKEEWEKRQNTIQRVYDEETGRSRLVRGEGEIIEEIVSRERHKEINRQATLGDGQFFQSTLKKKAM